MQYPKQSKTVHVEDLNGEVSIYDWQRLRVHNLNPTAARVWELCDGQTAPQEMAAQLHSDLNAEQAEELVWLSLKRLEQANLLENKVVQPSGRKVYTRREMLAKLGVAAVMLPVISSIVAPSPVEAQSPTTTTLVLFEVGGAGSDGNLGGRAGADARCVASANRPAGYANVRAFISVVAGDTIADMPGNYGVPTNLEIVGPNGTRIAANWAALLNTAAVPLDVGTNLGLAGVSVPAAGRWWTGANADGTLNATHCNNWTSGAAGDEGEEGHNSCGVGTEGWLTEPGATGKPCDSTFGLLCIAY